ncbi:phosphatase PAP2 family protein [Streptomyces sp. NPDC050617]|uniref:phosphatase PAP2 family protein n=1 Tax=Streptomyces sp. NPDC050617 TaxID=3154628 RepID=UPI0034124089
MSHTPALGKRPRWWTELPLIAVVYVLYSAGRLLARGEVSDAVGHGLSILHIEKVLGINLEHPLNRFFTQHALFGIPADFAYASLHYLVTPAILIWVFKCRPANYSFLRTWLMIATLIGLVGFTLLPTSPPRLLDAAQGFTDTMAQYGSYGWWGGDASAPRGLGGLTNQYAAMPSLHVGWALWCGVVLWRYGRGRWARIAGVAYPLGIAFVVMGTANHYLLDAVAGIAVMGVGLLLTRPALRLAERIGSRFPRLSRTAPHPGSHTGPHTASPGETPAAGAVVSGGCETSAGERFPRQAARTDVADSHGDARADSAATAAR